MAAQAISAWRRAEGPACRVQALGKWRPLCSAAPMRAWLVLFGALACGWAAGPAAAQAPHELR
ncbi:MAG: hypothetical protein OXT09_14645, partial [Myxococcales bacterium]|nr:hypothetical protein [Myxococcales bacterium]